MTGVNRKKAKPKLGLGARWYRLFGRREHAPEPATSNVYAAPMSGVSRAGRRSTPASYLILLLLVVAMVTGAFVYHLHVRFQGVWLGYETSRARAERARLLVERRELRLELASLKAPARVEAEAREKLGMEMPDHKSIVPIGKKLTPIMASGRVR